MKLIEDQIKDLRNSFPSISALSADSNSVFLKKYGPGGPGGKISFDGSYLPGKIYIADYSTKTKPSKDHPFIDRNPLFLYLKSDKSQNGEILICLDLNIIPPDYRGEVILKIWNQFIPIIKSNEQGPGQEPITNLYNSLRTILSGTGWQNSLTGFKKDFIQNVKIVDYTDWVRIPYVSSTKIEGLSISTIYNDYRSKLNR